MGELHLEISLDRLRRDYGVEVRSGRPQVVYRETVSGEAEAEGRFEREIAGRVHFGAVKLHLRPAARGVGLRVELPSGLPEPLREAIRQGIEEAALSGPLGWPVTDLEVKVQEAPLRERSSELGYKVAASQAFLEGCQRAGPVLLEPLMRLEVFCPEEFLGEVLGELAARRAKVEGIEHRPGVSVVQALAPLRLLFGYATALRNLTQGRATFTMHFEHYEAVPFDLAEEIVARKRQRNAAS